MGESVDFATVFARMEEEEKRNDLVFAIHNRDGDEKQKQLLIKMETDLFGRELTAHERETLIQIQEFDEYAWSLDERGGLKTGFDLFDEGLEGGIGSAFYLMAAPPNVGKSAFVLQLAKQVAEYNPDAYVEYFSLDDNKNEIIPRYIACDQSIKISHAKNPKRYLDEPGIIEKRNNGMKKLYTSIDRFAIRDSNYIGESIEALEEHIKNLKMTLDENRKILICIDSFYDLTTDQTNIPKDERHDYIAKQVKSFVNKYDVGIIATAHMRKINIGRRPTTEDLKDGNRLEYEAQFIGLLYNEVGVREESADLYWIDEEREDKMPVLEVRFGKNKLSSYKGTRFYEFIPEYSFCLEAEIESQSRYASLLHGQ